MPNPYWPFFDLELRTPRLVLRPGTDEDLVALAAITGDIHGEDELPFLEPWSKLPSPERERGSLQYHWSKRATLQPDDWTIEFMVVHEGKVIGSQGVGSKHFSLTKEVETGSWLGRPWQRQGFGKEMRAAVLFFAFDTLGAQAASTGFMHFNDKSRGVTEGLGYSYNGESVIVSDGKGVLEQRYRITRDQWEAGAKHYVPVEVTGAKPCLPLLGAVAPELEL